MEKKPIRYKEFKEGCLFPLFGLVFTVLFILMIIIALSLKSCHKSNYDYSPSTIHTVEDRTQTDEMKVFHSDKGMVTEENGLLIIKR